MEIKKITNPPQTNPKTYLYIFSIIMLLLGGVIFAYSQISTNNIVNLLNDYNFFEGLKDDLENYIKDLVSENEIHIKNNHIETITSFQFNISKNYFDVLLIGKTGVGKSTLINSILRLGKKEAARIGHTEPTTKKFANYTSKKLRGIRMWDSEGLSLNNNVDNILDKINNFIIERKDTNDLDNFIDVILYCIDSDNSRFEEEEADLIETLKYSYKNTSLPILLVFSRSLVEENYNNMKKAIIEKCNIKNTDDIIKVQAIDINQTIQGEKKILLRNNLYELVEKILDKISNSEDSNTRQTLERRIIHKYNRTILNKNEETEEKVKNKKYNTFHELLEDLMKEYDLDTSKEKMEDFENRVIELYIKRINVLMEKINSTNINDINSKIMINFINSKNKLEFAKIFQDIMNNQLLKRLKNCLAGKGERTIKLHLMRQINNAIEDIKNDATNLKTVEELEFNS